MHKFMNDDFLLANDTAKRLYHDYASQMPIYDYHSHLSAEEIFKDHAYTHIAEAWLKHDHYKWRTMRAMGFDESLITGDRNLDDKFRAYAITVQNCIGSPLYHWTHMELKTFFGFDEPLTAQNMDACMAQCNRALSEGGLTVRKMIEISRVALIGTTDDPVDDLKYHRLIQNDESLDMRVIPTFRPDAAMSPDQPGFSDWIAKLEASTISIRTLEDLVNALKMRADYFEELGCASADHGMDYVPYSPHSRDEVDAIFEKVMQGESLTAREKDQYRTCLLLELAQIYEEKNWVMQLHIGTMRNNNLRKHIELGKDTGFDSINDHAIAEPLSALLGRMHEAGALPKTVLYALNPKDNYVLGTMIGNFQETGHGKMQFGSAWWFNDHQDGMRKHLTDLANLGVLSTFIGMLTDSRSFLSFARHDYFRRILCNLIGEWVDKGEYPKNIPFLGMMVKKIAYYNAAHYFNREKTDFLTIEDYLTGGAGLCE